MKRLRRWMIGTALVAALALVALVLSVDLIARRAVERGAEQATGVDAKVSLVHVGFALPSFRMLGLRLANPEGFGDEDFLRMGNLYMRLPTRNLLAREIRVPELVIDDLELSLERSGGRSNYAEILHNLERGSTSGPAGAGGGRTIVIERVVVRGARAHLRASPLPSLDLAVPDVVLRNVGGSGTGSENVATIVRTVLVGVLGAVAHDTKGLPREVASELTSHLRELSLKRGAAGASEFGRAAGKAVEDAAEGIGRLFRREPPEPR